MKKKSTMENVLILSKFLKKMITFVKIFFWNVTFSCSNRILIVTGHPE